MSLGPTLKLHPSRMIMFIKLLTPWGKLLTCLVMPGCVLWRGQDRLTSSLTRPGWHGGGGGGGGVQHRTSGGCAADHSDGHRRSPVTYPPDHITTITPRSPLVKVVARLLKISCCRQVSRFQIGTKSLCLEHSLGQLKSSTGCPHGSLKTAEIAAVRGAGGGDGRGGAGHHPPHTGHSLFTVCKLGFAWCRR